MPAPDVPNMLPGPTTALPWPPSTTETQHHGCLTLIRMPNILFVRNCRIVCCDGPCCPQDEAPERVLLATVYSSCYSRFRPDAEAGEGRSKVARVCCTVVTCNKAYRAHCECAWHVTACIYLNKGPILAHKGITQNPLLVGQSASCPQKLLPCMGLWAKSWGLGAASTLALAVACLSAAM
jgi:hypothetical protein